MAAAPIICMLLEGVDAVAVARRMAGVTSGRGAELCSIRGDFSMSTSANIIHVADSVAAAREEETRLFEKDEIFDWESAVAPYLYGEDEK